MTTPPGAIAPTTITLLYNDHIYFIEVRDLRDSTGDYEVLVGRRIGPDKYPHYHLQPIPREVLNTQNFPETMNMLKRFCDRFESALRRHEDGLGV